MHSKTWIWVGLGAVLVLAAANLAILAAFPAGQQHVQEPVKMVDWIVVSAPGLEYRSGSGEMSPVIVYDGKNDSWLLQNDTVRSRTLDLGDFNGVDPSSPKGTRYTPDIAIKGDTISIDFLIENRAREDCAGANLTLTTVVERPNPVTGSPYGELVSSSTPITVPIGDLAAGEWCEVRVTADLPRPGPEEILSLTIGLAAPYTITTPNGTPVDFDFRRVTVTVLGSNTSWKEEIEPGSTLDPDYNRARLPGGSAVFIVQGTNALPPVTLPTMTAG
ncbi:hypothetical protein [Methanoculleus sp. 10]|jgi:hypothetical protein|uniref:hypothetical protein n=1 Tax=Methanoculleus sp. 10 TaxID=430615 RepID=UPI001B4354AF|nr:hypothetical protein [Methanoculleus sp. 10]MBP7410007.1 hypothetical protein [Methanoculleus sp.]